MISEKSGNRVQTVCHEDFICYKHVISVKCEICSLNMYCQAAILLTINHVRLANNKSCQTYFIFTAYKICDLFNVCSALQNSASNCKCSCCDVVYVFVCVCLHVFVYVLCMIVYTTM